MTSRHHPLYAAIDAKLAEIAGAVPEPPPWYEAWAELGPQAPGEERLAVYQAVRAAGSVPAEAGFFLVAWMLDILTDDRAEEALREVEDRLEAVRQKYGLEEDASAEEDDAPAEYREAMQQVHDAWDALYLARLEGHGEHDMARLFQEDQEQFDQVFEAGRQFFHEAESDDETEDEDWLDELLDAVSACVEPDNPMGPLGLRYREEGGFYEVWIYPTPVELLGARTTARWWCRASPWTWSSFARSSTPSRTAAGIPSASTDLHRPVVTGAGEALAVGAEGHAHGPDG